MVSLCKYPPPLPLPPSLPPSLTPSLPPSLTPFLPPTPLPPSHPLSLSDPIPGGCSMTSYIEIDAQVHPTFTTYTTSITFQDSNQGFLPGRTPVPICDGGNKSVTKLEYRVYRKCLRVRDFSVSNLFSALEDMLTARDLKGLVSPCTNRLRIVIRLLPWEPAHTLIQCVYVYCIVLSKCPYLCKCPPPFFLMVAWFACMDTLYVQMASPCKHSPPNF